MRAPAMPRPAPCRSATHRPAAPAAAAVVPQPTSRRSATATSSRPLRRPSRRCTRNARPTTASRYGGAASAALHRRRRAAAVLAAAGRRGSRCVCSPQAKRAQEPRAFQNTKKYAMSVQGSNVAMKGALQLRGGGIGQPRPPWARRLLSGPQSLFDAQPEAHAFVFHVPQTFSTRTRRARLTPTKARRARRTRWRRRMTPTPTPMPTARRGQA